VVQLLVSVFQQDISPETLGFNIQFDSLQLDTIQAVKELPEVRFDVYGFRLHV
jgi:hypothetical protein